MSNEVVVYESDYHVDKYLLGPDASMYFKNFAIPLWLGIDKIYEQNWCAAYKRLNYLAIKYYKPLLYGDSVSVQFFLENARDDKNLAIKVLLDEGKCALIRAVFDKLPEDNSVGVQFQSPSRHFLSKDYKVVFGMADVGARLSCPEILRLTGEVRELYGDKILPDFWAMTMSGQVLLKTHSVNFSIFYRPLVSSDFRVCVYCVERGNTYFIVKYDFIDPANNHIFVSGSQKIACMSATGKEHIPVPKNWQAALDN